MSKASIIVVDQKGLRGRINDTEFTPERDSEVRIRFSGHQIVVPAEMLVAQSDGNFFLPLSFAALVEAREQRNQQGDEPLVFPVIEEELHVKKRQVEHGVRVTKAVHEQPEQVELPLVSEEVLVVQKQWMLKEEAHIITKRTEQLRAIQETLRREEVVVEPIQNAASGEARVHPVRAEEDEKRDDA